MANLKEILANLSNEQLDALLVEFQNAQANGGNFAGIENPAGGVSAMDNTNPTGRGILPTNAPLSARIGRGILSGAQAAGESVVRDVRQMAGFKPSPQAESLGNMPVYKMDENGQLVPVGSVQRNAKVITTPKGSASNATPEEIQSTAQGIINGDIPPDRKYYRDTLRVDAELEKQGFDMSSANSEWKATQRFLSSMNSEKQIRLRQAITSVKDALGGLEGLNNELGRSELAPLNKAQLVLQANSGNQLAVKYLGQINIIRDELAQVFMGGNSPTDKALDLARETIDKNWSPKQLQAAIENVRTNLGYRENAINYASTQGTNPGAGGGTRYLPVKENPDTQSQPTGTEMPYSLGKQGTLKNKVGKYTLIQ